jgi:hypothetical protein
MDQEFECDLAGCLWLKAAYEFADKFSDSPFYNACH